MLKTSTLLYFKIFKYFLIFIFVIYYKYLTIRKLFIDC